MKLLQNYVFQDFLTCLQETCFEIFWLSIHDLNFFDVPRAMKNCIRFKIKQRVDAYMNVYNFSIGSFSTIHMSPFLLHQGSSDMKNFVSV